jgi:hypothetical protein
MKDIYEKAIELGIETASHCTDLYLPVNEQTRALINQYEYKQSVHTFRNRITGQLWFDIPFAYSPAWDHACKDFSTPVCHEI